MLTRTKTLPLPSIAARPPGFDPARMVGPVLVIGQGAHLERARAAVAAVKPSSIGGRAPRLVLIGAGALDAVASLRAADGAPRVWLVADDSVTTPPSADLDGVAAEVTPRLIEALLAHALGAPARAASVIDHAAVVATSLLEDQERYADRIAHGFGAVDGLAYLRDGSELRSLGRPHRAVPPALRLAADTGLPVVCDDDGAIVTWVGAWCARPAAVEDSGLIGLCFTGPGTPGDASLAELELLASRLGVELSWLRVHRGVIAETERLRATAMIDALTGTWTRAAFERTVDVEIAAARRRGEALSLAVFDVDGLRRVNEQYGHRVGDAVLAHVAAVVRANVRVNDELGRLGDDELALVLMNVDLERSVAVIEKLVRRIHETPLVVDGRRIRFTVRAGLTGFAAGERTGDAAFGRAMHGLVAAADQSSRVAICRTSEIRPAVNVLDDDAQVATPIGSTIGGTYRIVHEISRGASGVVYRGVDLGLGRPVAIKVLRHDLGHDAGLVDRFRREASILASLGHPNLVDVYAFGADEDVYFVMELVEGPTVADVVEDAMVRGDWLDPEAVAQLIAEVGDALEAMHAAGLVHCDVKAENIILDRSGGRAVLLDVGESKRGDEQRRRAGTPGYAAPETFGDGDETAAIDVYALGCTAYLMLTARLPFGTGDALAILSRQIDAPAPPPSSIRRGLPAAVDAVIGRALAIDPRQRYATPAAFAIALRAALRATGDLAGDRPLDRRGQLRELTVEASSLEAARVDGHVIRGAAFRVAAKVLSARAGEPWLRRVAEARRDLAEFVQPTLAPMSWQPVDALLDLIEHATGDLEQRDVLRSIGRGLVSVTFTHLYGADPTSMTTHGLVASIPLFWDRYFGFGQPTVLATGDHRVVLHIAGVEPPIAHLVVGFIERIVELTAETTVQVQVSSDGNGSMFQVEWH